MDPINVGLLSILPPIIAIALALITKEVLSSLIIGVFFGTFTYSFASGHGIMKGFSTAFELMAAKIGDNATMLLFLSFLGILVVLVTNAGGAYAYGKWASTKIRSKAASQLATCLLGVIIFVDDYFNCLTVGTVMKPVTDKYNVARAKLAYLIDSTAAPVCIIAPISSWAAAVGSTLATAKIFESDMMAFIATIPFNLYALLTILMVFIVAGTKMSYGPMRHLEIAAMKGELGEADSGSSIGNDDDRNEKGKVKDLLIPIIGLIIMSIMSMLYTGGLFAGKGVGFAEAFGNCNSSLSLAFGGFGAILLTFILYMPRKIMSFKDFMLGVTEGIKIMVPAITILVLAWTISGVCRDLLSTGEYIGTLVQNGNFPMILLPMIIFIVAAFLSFSMGTAWGTFGILIPIVVIICEPTLDTIPQLMTVTLAATLGGSVFGDHCSPISDTTILSSTGAYCPHMDHVSTQIPYALTVAVSCIVGYAVSAITNFNVFATLASGVVCLLVLLTIISRIYAKKEPVPEIPQQTEE
ncbi:MAG: Na+/H+ antiporter NhaC family protein [Eubacteriaceae bacterium]|nr:Na+/H+ antiporter NhaC family protein [Eubacteriaceae bacterium]